MKKFLVALLLTTSVVAMRASELRKEVPAEKYETAGFLKLGCKVLSDATTPGLLIAGASKVYASGGFKVPVHAPYIIGASLVIATHMAFKNGRSDSVITRAKFFEPKNIVATAAVVGALWYGSKHITNDTTLKLLPIFVGVGASALTAVVK